MPCPHCAVTTVVEQEKRTALGYRTFRCRACRRHFNERSGTPFNHLQPTDVVLLVVLWRLRYKLSLRDVAEMFLERGFVFTHETVRDWEARFAPLLHERLRAKRRGTVGLRWHTDETYAKVAGRWCSLYRAIDREGNLVEAMLSEKRDMAAAHTNAHPVGPVLTLRLLCRSGQSPLLTERRGFVPWPDPSVRRLRSRLPQFTLPGAPDDSACLATLFPGARPAFAGQPPGASTADRAQAR